MSVEQVRHLIPDFEEVDWRDDNTPSTLFPDEVIQTYLDVNDGNVKRAAATAMRALAVSEAVISKVIKTEDLQTDGAKVARALLEGDSHAPSRYRVNGVVRNMDAWYKAFDVKPTDKLYLAPEERVRIW